jgi:hypothetical protein
MRTGGGGVTAADPGQGRVEGWSADRPAVAVRVAWPGAARFAAVAVDLAALAPLAGFAALARPEDAGLLGRTSISPWPASFSTLGLSEISTSGRAPEV